MGAKGQESGLPAGGAVLTGDPGLGQQLTVHPLTAGSSPGSQLGLIRACEPDLDLTPTASWRTNLEA